VLDIESVCRPSSEATLQAVDACDAAITIRRTRAKDQADICCCDSHDAHGLSNCRASLGSVDTRLQIELVGLSLPGFTFASPFTQTAKSGDRFKAFLAAAADARATMSEYPT
jgi:hypothetical protein